jgi:hypothetical protein
MDAIVFLYPEWRSVAERAQRPCARTWTNWSTIEVTNAEDDAPLAPPADLAEPSSDVRATKILCANCGAELFGPHCYSCGQPVKGMVRQLTSILADVGDTILNIDSRIFRTLWPLLTKPGFLTNEYLAGRRVRYVTPFRLYFFLSVVAFLVMQVGLDATFDMKNAVKFDGPDTEAIGFAQTPEDVAAIRDKSLASLEQAKAATAISAKAVKGLDKAEDKIRARADRRIDYLKRVAAAKAEGKAAPPDPDVDKDEDFNIEFGSKEWNPKKTPVQIAWLPAFANAKLNVLATHFVDNLPRIKKDPKPFLLGAFGTLPQVLFFLMPLFALLLKIFYIFKRRLYMEHMMVALHSHSFIFAALLLITLCGLLQSWTNDAAAWLSPALGWIMFGLGWWMPIYLLIMQKRVYRQGWFFTVVKYLCIGVCYTMLIAMGIALAFVISLATT